MSEIVPLYSGEAQFRRYSDTSTQGQQVVFALPGRDELQAFIGKEGRRFMVVCVEIGDDEAPVPAIQPPKTREPLGELCYRAVMLCQDAEFQDWINREAKAEGIPSKEQARDIICEWCGVDSRKALDDNGDAARLFRKYVLGPWQKHQQARRYT